MKCITPGFSGDYTKVISETNLPPELQNLSLKTTTIKPGLKQIVAGFSHNIRKCFDNKPPTYMFEQYYTQNDYVNLGEQEFLIKYKSPDTLKENFDDLSAEHKEIVYPYIQNYVADLLKDNKDLYEEDRYNQQFNTVKTATVESDIDSIISIYAEILTKRDEKRQNRK